MSDVKVKLFKATWCGHCNSFKPEWEKLQKEAGEMGVKCVAFDADADKNEVAKENIEGFPTIKIEVDGSSTEYNGARSADAILNEVMKLKGKGSGRPMLRGGGAGTENFYQQYRKYKAKYLRLKHQTGRV